MARKKHQVAPFEIVAGLGKSSSTRESQEEDASGQENQQEQPQTPVEKPRRHVVPPARPAASPYPTTPTATAEAAETAEPGKLTVSMGHLTAGLVIGGMILLLAGAFVLGRMSARPGDEATAGMNNQTGQPPARETGKYYMVIEAMDGKTAADQMRAEHIAWFLDRRGIETSVHKYRYPKPNQERVAWVVLSYRGFPGPEDPAVRRFAEQMRQLGAQYSKEYNVNYDFAPRKRRDSTRPWLEVWKKS